MYDPDEIPERYNEEELVVAYLDESIDEWIECDCTVDLLNNTITLEISHFTIFSILTRPMFAIPVETIRGLLVFLRRSKYSLLVINADGTL